jgi:hypothetical protein
MVDESSQARQSYGIVSIQPTDPPPGAEGTIWHRYVISFGGDNNIEGIREGKLSVATGAVEEIVAQLNLRHRGKNGRVHLVPTPKKKTQK